MARQVLSLRSTTEERSLIWCLLACATMPFCLILCYTKLPFSRKSRTVQREKKDEMTAILQSLTSYSYYSDETGANVGTGRFRIRDPL